MVKNLLTMNKVTDKHFDIIFFIILFIAFYLQDRLSPFIADDYAYRFSMMKVLEN